LMRKSMWMSMPVSVSMSRGGGQADYKVCRLAYELNNKSILALGGIENRLLAGRHQ
jgi:hypothetical protein